MCVNVSDSEKHSIRIKCIRDAYVNMGVACWPIAGYGCGGMSILILQSINKCKVLCSIVAKFRDRHVINAKKPGKRTCLPPSQTSSVEIH